MQKLIIILTVTALLMGAVRRIEAVELIPEVDLYVGPAAGTSVNVHDTFNIVLNASAYSTSPTTVVLDAIALEDCHGSLYGANIEIVPEPATIAVLGFGGLLFLHPRK